ncbi:MAG: heme biosynthesis HemY N-terminal domain-containing protein [Pseudomonadota bacterium]|nr:tetratricopeptide repeat protein [Gammaproteobacteria bacterium]MBU1926578.1 tetratricopeptide repeat protein [Gammaproteobacteria bacterium]MBU2546090.1 tetratricopeptide repeat protein [Gammaproteobacteria bacterium]
MRIIFYFLILIAALLAGIALKTNPGYVLIAYSHWTAEMPLWLALVIIVGGFLLWYVIAKIFSTIHHSFAYWSNWRKERVRKKNMLLFQQGLLNLYTGCWKRAEKMLVQSVQLSDIPMAHYLGATQAASALGCYDRAAKYIQKIKTIEAGEIFIDIVHAQTLLAQEQYELALKLLEKIRMRNTKQSCVLKLLQETYEKLDRWRALIGLLPTLKKYELLNKEQARAYEIKLYCSLFSSKQLSENDIKQTWKNAPRELRKQSNVLFSYCSKLLEMNEDDEAIELLARHLSNFWDDQLCALYGNIGATDLKKQLKIAEKWFNKQQSNPVLLLTLAKIAGAQGEWKKAEKYLLASLQLKETPQTYALLGLVYERLGNIAESLKAYRHASENLINTTT